ncbi:hypothetical protein [Parafrankia sp. FMc2]|uniref:hypothetical protein n=1 Tax=Parafrankia sp. FMc2 TaxID=3233196 RepID=UPI0034D4182E
MTTYDPQLTLEAIDELSPGRPRSEHMLRVLGALAVGCSAASISFFGSPAA